MEKEARLQQQYGELHEQKAVLQEQTREREAASMNQLVKKKFWVFFIFLEIF